MDAHSKHKGIQFIWLASLCSVLLIHWQKGGGLNFWPLPSSRAPYTWESSFWTTVSTNAECNYFYFSSSNLQLLFNFPTQQNGLISYSYGHKGCRAAGQYAVLPLAEEHCQPSLPTETFKQAFLSLPFCLTRFRDGFASVYRAPHPLLNPSWPALLL